ncbi:uncharacterized protein KZ484_005940 isoform 1-T1 [Pholidichthys leucotaenia]
MHTDHKVCLHSKSPALTESCTAAPHLSGHTAHLEHSWSTAGAQLARYCQRMAGRVTWTMLFIFAAVSGSPVLHSVLVVQAGQNASLTCNLTSGWLTWLLLQSDQQLLPLLTVQRSNLGGLSTENHSHNTRISIDGALKGGEVSLIIQDVQEVDAGVYFCIGRGSGNVQVSRGTLLSVKGVNGTSSADTVRQPCLSLEICVILASLLFCFICIFGFCLWSGKLSVCCCRGEAAQQITEGESLHYSSLKHSDKPRPTGRGGTGLVNKQEVTYSTVMTCRNLNG